MPKMDLGALLGMLGAGREPVDVSDNSFGSTIIRVLGVDLTHPMAHRHAGKDQKFCREVAEGNQGNIDVVDYFSQCVGAGLEPTKQGCEEFCDARVVARVPEALKAIIAHLTEGGALSPTGTHYEKDGTLHANGECASYGFAIERLKEQLDEMAHQFSTPPKPKPEGFAKLDPAMFGDFEGSETTDLALEG